MTADELASACASIVEDYEVRESETAVAVALMFGTDPSNGWLVVYPLTPDDLDEKAEESDLESVLNPAEHREELELALPEDMAARLPKGTELRDLVEKTVRTLRTQLPKKLVYMTDPDCEELRESVASAKIPRSLRFVRKLHAKVHHDGRRKKAGGRC